MGIKVVRDYGHKKGGGHRERIRRLKQMLKRQIERPKDLIGDLELGAQLLAARKSQFGTGD